MSSKKEKIEFVRGLINSKECSQNFYFRYDTQEKIDMLKEILSDVESRPAPMDELNLEINRDMV